MVTTLPQTRHLLFPHSISCVLQNPSPSQNPLPLTIHSPQNPYQELSPQAPAPLTRGGLGRVTARWLGGKITSERIHFSPKGGGTDGRNTSALPGSMTGVRIPGEAHCIKSSMPHASGTLTNQVGRGGTPALASWPQEVAWWGAGATSKPRSPSMVQTVLRIWNIREQYSATASSPTLILASPCQHPPPFQPEGRTPPSAARHRPRRASGKR